VSERPSPVPALDLPRFHGGWFIVVTNYAYWRARTHPHVEYAPLPPDGDRPRFSDTLRFSRATLIGGRRTATLAGVDTQDRADTPGCFVWRGNGLLAFIRSRWSVVILDDDYRWAVTWFERSNIGTAPGMDVYAREPVLDPSLCEDIVARIRAHPFLGSRSDGLFATEQSYRPVRPYALG
jgi:hypothetical protein